MPSSSPKLITPIVEKILTIKPKTVLDVGFGYGKWGYLCREYLETWEGRISKIEWKVKIVGLDAYHPFSELEWTKVFYDEIVIGDAWRTIKTLGCYDLVIATDILEHLDKKCSLELFDECLKRSRKCFIMSVPLGEGWLNNYVPYENEYDKHRCVWRLEEIESRNPSELKLFEERRGKIALAIFDR